MKQPRYSFEFTVGDFIFTKTPGNPVSEAISTMLDTFDDSWFDPSHVLIVQDDRWGIEAAEAGVKWCRLQPIFDGKKSYVIAKPDWRPEVANAIIRCALGYYGRIYDVTGLIIGFPLQLITGLSKIIKPLRKLPLPLHIPGSFVCSAFAAQVLKDTGYFNDVKLLKEWHTSRITPAMLLRDFPWRMKNEYNPVHTADKPDAGGNIPTVSERTNKFTTESNESYIPDAPNKYDEQGQGRSGSTPPTHATDVGWKSNPICAECSGDSGGSKKTKGTA